MFSEKNPNMAHKLNIGEGRSTEIVFALPSYAQSKTKQIIDTKAAWQKTNYRQVKWFARFVNNT